MSEGIEIVFGLLGGLAVFIYGMNMMSECLQKAAGEKMKSILALLTKNRVMGVIAGALVTAVLQSSSATTVMAIGFVSAGLMTLPQAISIIFGSNIGTTITAQIIAFKISDYIYIIIFIGFIVAFIAKSEKIKNIGNTIFAFGLLFEGIEMMGDVMKPLASSPVFTNMIAQVADIPILGVLVGALMTMVVQSSSATIAVLQNFASQAGSDGVTSILGLAGAIPILLGDNIGTTITALLASIGQSKDAKRTAIAHSIFNISGAVLFIWFVKPFASLVAYISPKGVEVEIISRQIANAHTLFNLTMTIIWIFLLKYMVILVCKIIPDGKHEVADPARPQFLDNNLISQPAAALNLVTKEVIHTSEIVDNMLTSMVTSLKNKNEQLMEQVVNQKDIVESLYDRIMEYLSEMFSAGVLTERQATETAKLMYSLSDVERMGILSGNTALAISDKKYKYSDEALGEISESLTIIQKMYCDAMESLQKDQVSEEDADRIKAQKEQVVDLDIEMRKAHMERVKTGKCKPAMTQPYLQILHNIDRMGNSCVNLADIATGEATYMYFLVNGDTAAEQIESR